MVARRRARRRPLVQATAATAVVAGTAAAANGAGSRQQNRKNAHQDKAAASQPGAHSETDQQYEPIPTQSTPPEEVSPPGLTPPELEAEMMARLQQLSELHDSGILTDEEFSAARQRLLGA